MHHAYDSRKADVGQVENLPVGASGLQPDLPCSKVPGGRLTLICGCMFSGKTTEMLGRLSTFPPPTVLLFKHVIDLRYRVDAVVSHQGQARAAVRIASPGEILGHIRREVEVVAVDEGHFFETGLADIVHDMLARGINTIITSLDVDSWGRPFTVTRRLRTLAREPTLLHAVCARCGAVADRTQRLTPIVDGNMVGGPESYEARCQACWTPPPEPPPR
jgi:thymidine kinase